MAEHFTRFARRKYPNYYLKIAEQQHQEYNSRDDIVIWRISAELNIPLYHEPSEKQALMEITIF